MKYRKIVATDINRLELREEVFSEKIENPDEFIVKNHYSMISAGTELACIRGEESFFKIPGTPGYTSVGEVMEAGSALTFLKPGDMVYTFGPHAEIYKISYGNRWSGMCIKPPAGLKLSWVPFTKMASIAMAALRVSEIELGDFVLVTGLGPIGNLAVQLAQLQGATVVALDISEKRLETARKCGIVHALNSNDPHLEEKFEQLGKGGKFSTFIDATGQSKVFESFLKYVGTYGEAILLGSPRAAYHTNLTDTLNHVHLWTRGSITLKGALEFRFPTHETEFVKHSTERNSRIIMELLKDGKIQIEPFFTHLADPASAQEMYDGLREKPDEFMGVVFDWTKQ